MTTPEHPDQPEQPLSPADEARVRRLLADARATEPMPDHVAARLDATLAELGRERATAAGPAEGGDVVPLAARRRRRVTALLAAAAAVVVVGVGITETVRDGAGDAESAGGASVDRTTSERPDDRAAEDADEGAAEAPADTALQGEDAATPPAKRRTTPEVRRVPAAPPVVRVEQLRRDVRRVQDAWLPADARSLYRGTVLVLGRGFRCADTDHGRGVLVGVRYDGAPALLAFRAPVGSSQVVDVLPCGPGERLRSITVPAP